VSPEILKRGQGFGVRFGCGAVVCFVPGSWVRDACDCGRDCGGLSAPVVSIGVVPFFSGQLGFDVFAVVPFPPARPAPDY
jgi:hypothetical protein